MILYCHMTSSAPAADEILLREIHIPDGELNDPTNRDEILEAAFHFGQNEVQPVDGMPSVSVGDVIELPDSEWKIRLYRVLPVGFMETELDLLEVVGFDATRLAYANNCVRKG